jgi:flagellar hook-associated protein 2
MATNFVNALGAGSGIDTQKLAKDLMEAAREPRKAIIDEKITKSEARISGYGVIQFSLGELKTAFSGLNDLSDFASLQVANTQASALGVVSSPSAAAGSYQVNVTQVALAQRTASNGFAARDTALTVGSLNLTIGGLTESIAVSTATPAGIVSAINGANKGITAQLIQTSGASPWKIVITGEEGAAKSFGLTATHTDGTTAVDLGFATDANKLQTAQNSILTVNGLSVERTTNSVSDVIDGVTFNLATVTSGAARIDLTRDTSGITQKINDLVTAYNNFEENLKILGDRASEVEEFGGALAGDSLLQNIRSQVRAMLTSTSSTPGSTVTAPRDVGLSFDRNGVLQFDKEKLSTQLQSNFDEVAQMFSANTNNQTIYSVADAGVAGDAVKAIDEMMRSTGLIAQQTDNATQQVDRFKADLEKLEDQMKKLLERYTRQFSAMESIVGSSNSLRESLKGTFEGMANAYKK